MVGLITFLKFYYELRHYLYFHHIFWCLLSMPSLPLQRFNHSCLERSTASSFLTKQRMEKRISFIETQLECVTFVWKLLLHCSSLLEETHWGVSINQLLSMTPMGQNCLRTDMGETREDFIKKKEI